MADNCSVCFYWRLNTVSNDGEGHCHRNAPRARTRPDSERWPVAYAHELCGEFSPSIDQGSQLHKLMGKSHS